MRYWFADRALGGPWENYLGRHRCLSSIIRAKEMSWIGEVEKDEEEIEEEMSRPVQWHAKRRKHIPGIFEELKGSWSYPICFFS